jgi:hypothetical protein
MEKVCQENAKAQKRKNAKWDKWLKKCKKAKGLFRVDVKL